MNEVTWLYLDLNSFFASCEQQENPALRGKPVAVVPMMADNTSVLAASYPAKKFGVKTGTRVGDARQMCPGIIFIEADHDVYVRYHHKVIEVVESCIPIEGVMSIDEIACRLTGSQTQVENAIKVAHKIKAALKKEVGEAICASIGLSVNRYLAKMATDMQKPDGLTIIRKADLPHKLYSLQLRDVLGVGRKMEEHLLRHNVKTVEQLCSLSSLELKKIWGGVWGERVYLWLKGEDVRLPPTKNRSLSHEHVLPPDKRSFQGAQGVAKKLLTKLCVRLRKNNYYTKSMSISVKFFSTPSTYWEKSERFSEVRDTLSLMRRLNLMWKECPRDKKPLKVSVSFGEVCLKDTHQFSFFEDPKLDEISTVMDKINKKHGREMIHLGATHNQKDAAPTRIAFSRIPDLDDLE